MDVLGLGTAAMDIVLQCEDLPREDGFSFVHQEDLMPGGSCANVLVTLANMGVKTGLVAQMGDDHYGRAFKEDLKNSGVNTEWIFFKEQGVSLHTFVTVAQKGSKAIFCHLGDSLLALQEDVVYSGMLRGVKVFYTDMFPKRPALKLARWCKGQGIPIVFNLECSPGFMKLCQVEPEDLEEILSLADLIFSYREGLTELAQRGDYLSAGQWIYDQYRPKHGLVFTLGEEGAICFHAGGVSQTAALKVKAIDTTGAGDAFIGGFIYTYLLQKKECREALKFANACAALKCTQRGARLHAGEKDVWAVLNQDGKKSR